MLYIQAPFRLIHRDGRIIHFDSLEELISYGLDPRYLGDVDHKAVRRYPVNWTGERWFENEYWTDHIWIIRDCSDQIVPVYWYRDRAISAGWDYYWYGWRHSSLFKPGFSSWRPGSKRKRRYNFLRYPRTQQERRETLRALDELAEYGVHPSWSRHRYLCTAWDDIPRTRERNWKRQRRTKYRSC